MSIIPGTTIEYEDKKHGEVTSAYTYNKCFNAWNVYTIDDSSANQLCRWQYPTETIRLDESENTNYVDIVWLFNSPIFPDSETLLVTNDENDTLPIITKLDIQKYKLVIDGFYTVKATDAGIADGTPTYHDAGYELQDNEYIKRYLTHWENKEDPTETTVDTIPVLRWHQGDDVWYIKIPDNFYQELNNHPPTNQLKATAQTPYDDQTDTALLRAPITASNTWNLPTLGYKFIVGSNEDYTFIFYNPTEQANNLFIALNSVDAMLKSIALLGVYFEYDGTMYLGFMDESGQTTGEYLTEDDWEKSSQWDSDNINNFNEHNPPYVPPYSDEDNTDPITTNGAPFGTGLAHYYVTTVDSVTLQHISEAMSTWDIDGTKKDLYKNLISCKIIKPPAGIPSTSGVFTIYGVKPQYDGSDITIPEVTGNPSITFGPYSISRKFNDFRDYAPYSKAEIFIPYCGWTALPSHVIGRSVYVDYFTDVIAGTVKAIIRCNNNAVAEAAGVMAVDIPFAAQNVGAKVAAATTGMLSYGQGALQASVGIGQAVATKGKSGIKNITSGLASVIGAYNQMAMVNNENWTEINGKSGDGCALAGIDTIIIKITRPKYGSYAAPYYVPADYGHTVGFVSMKKTTVGSCTGLIICDNVDTSGISGATDRERQLIKEYLESGVIVKHPE